MADSYNRHVGAAITSLLENCTMPVVIHIMYDANLNMDTDSYEENKCCYLSFQEKYDVEILLHHVEIPAWYHSLRGSKILSVGTYYRLFIPDVLPDISKVIYLDGDVIVTMDLKEFWDIDISNAPLAARVDPMFQEGMKEKPKSFIPVYEKFNFTKDDLLRYFNAGILYLNLDYIRSTMNLSETGGDYLHTNLTTPRADQDALNFLFKDTVQLLPDRYNLFAYEAGENVPSACNHYVTRKPWKVYKESIDAEYWKYLFLSPWCKDVSDFVGYMSIVGNVSPISMSSSMDAVPIIQLTKWLFVYYYKRILRTVHNIIEFRWK